MGCCSPTEDEVIFFFNNFIQGNIDSLEYNRYLIDILVNSIYLSDEEDGTQKMTVLLNTQNGQETVTLNDLTQCSSNVHMVPLTCPNTNPAGLPKAWRPGRLHKEQRRPRHCPH